MLSVKGTYRNGVIHLNEPVNAQEGQSVIITFMQEAASLDPKEETDWDEFERITEECSVDTGIEDLAHQHDHYIHGTPKREPYP